MNFEHIFDELEISVDPFAVCELRGQADLGLGRDVNATVHYFLEGTGVLSMKDAPPINVSPGTLVLLPALQSHRISSVGQPGVSFPTCNPAAANLRHLLKVTAEDQSTDQGRVLALCAHLKIGLRGAENVIDLLRTPMCERTPKTVRYGPRSIVWSRSSPSPPPAAGR